jgi:hypothetical protein
VPTSRQAEILSINGKAQPLQKSAAAIIDHFAPDAYGLLILAPEVALGSGWLGGDRVVGRAAVRDLLIKAARYNDAERKRLSIHLPSRAITLRLDELEKAARRNATAEDR